MTEPTFEDSVEMFVVALVVEVSGDKTACFVVVSGVAIVSFEEWEIGAVTGLVVEGIWDGAALVEEKIVDFLDY